MAQIDLKTLSSKMRNREISNIYYIYGSDVIGVERATKQIIKTVVGENEDIALTRFNGKKLDFDELYDTIQMMPMMSEYNCIFINDYDCEKPRENMAGHKAEDINKKLLDTIKDIPPYTVIVFNVTGFEVAVKEDWKTKKRTITDKNKKLADFAEKNGICCEIPVKSANELAKDIANKVSARGGAISLDNAKQLAEMCLSDTLTIENEIDKLCAYTQGEEITGPVIKMLVHRQSDMTVYKLANAVAAMDRKSAFEAIDELNIDNNSRGLVFAAVSGTFIDLYRAACAKKAGKSTDDVICDFGYARNRAFAVKNAYRDCSRMSIRRIRQCITILNDTAVQMNSTQTDPRTALEQAVTKMFMIRN